MVYDLAWASGGRWRGGEQGSSVGVSLSIGVDCGRGTLRVRDAVGTNHGGSGTTAVIAVELEVSFSSTVAAVNVLGSWVRGFLWWSGSRRGWARVERSGGQVVATKTVDFCF